MSRAKSSLSELEGSTGDEETTTGDEASDDLGENGVDVLDAMGFVDNDILKRELLESRFLDKADLVRGNADFEVLGQKTVGENLGTLFFRASEKFDVEIGCPFLEFSCPVLESRLGHDDEMGAVDIEVVFEVGEEGGSLQSFTDTLYTR